MPTQKTTQESEVAAYGRFHGDWDADGVTTVHLPRDVAERLLAERGWQAQYRDPQARYADDAHVKLDPEVTDELVGWASPGGTLYDHTSEALQIALTAENA